MLEAKKKKKERKKKYGKQYLYLKYIKSLRYSNKL